MEGKLLTPQQVAERLSVSLGEPIAETRVRMWCRTAKLPGARLFGRSWLVPETDVEDVEELGAAMASSRDRFGDLLPARPTLDAFAATDEGEGA